MKGWKLATRKSIKLTATNLSLSKSSRCQKSNHQIPLAAFFVHFFFLFHRDFYEEASSFTKQIFEDFQVVIFYCMWCVTWIFCFCSIVNTFDPFLCRLWLVGSLGFLCINCRILSFLFLHMNPHSITLRQTPTTASNVMTVHKFNTLLSSLLGNAYQLIKKDTFQLFRFVAEVAH